MARVPHSVIGRTRTPQTQLAPMQVSGVSPGAFGAGIAKGLVSLGQGLEVRESYKKQDDKFHALAQQSDWSMNLQENLVNERRSSPLEDKNYYDRVDAVINNASKNFLATLTPEQQAEFEPRIAEQANAFREKELAFDLEKKDTYYRTNIQDEQQRQRSGVYENVDSLEQRRKAMMEHINSSGLASAEKASLIRSMNEDLEKAGYRSAYKQFKAAPLQSQNMNGAYSYYVGLGVKPIIAAAIMGNLGVESGDLSADVIEGRRAGDKGTAFGAAQWRFERKAALKTFAEGKGRPWTDLKVQLDFVLHEMQSGQDEGAARAWRLMQDATTVEEATEIFMNHYERPSNKPEVNHIAKRQAKARALFSGEQFPALEDDPRFLNVSYEDRIAIQRDADTELSQENAAQAALVKEQRSSMLNNLYTGLGIDGTLGLADVQDLRGKIDMTYEELNKAKTILEERNKQVADFNRGQGKLGDASSIWDPHSTDDKKAADAIALGAKWDQRFEAKDEDAAAELYNFTSQSNMPPPAAMSKLNAMTYSPDWSQQKYALNTLAQLDLLAPEAAGVFLNEDEVKRLELYRSASTLYDEENLQRIMQGPKTTAERQEYTASAEAAKKILEDEFDRDPAAISGKVRSWWGDEAASIRPAAATTLARDYETLFTDYYARMGDKRAAETATVNHLKRYWGRTEADGKGTFMKYPPEKTGYKPLAGSFDWIENQVRAELNLKGDQNFELIPHESTMQRVLQGKPASYYVSYQDTEGVWRNNGQKYYFEIGPDEIDRHVGWVETQQTQAQAADAVAAYQEAEAYSFRTGVPIPQDIEEQYQQALKFMEQAGEAQRDPPAPTGSGGGGF